MKALEHFVNHPDQDEMSGIFRFTYLQGLDGKVSGRDHEQTSSKGKDKEAPLLKDSIRSIELSEMERPIGESQLDYMRRLASTIREMDKREMDKCSWRDKLFAKCWGIETIGVTGSDVYDKLLVLQALHQSLPEKVFFTTDLDARYTEPEQIEWTRNLIVASHFGLQLEEHIQRDIPPFRDSYQTSAFYTVLRALEILHCRGEAQDPCNENKLENTLSPKIMVNQKEEPLTYDPTVPVRLFEIGNKKPVAIGLFLDPTLKKQDNPETTTISLHESPPPARSRLGGWNWVPFLATYSWREC